MQLESRVDSVTVYAQGAVVRRLATIRSPAEGTPQVLLIAGLPLALKAASLRASVVAGPADLRVLDVRSSLVARATEGLDVPAEQGALDVAEETLSRLELEHAAVGRDIVDLQALHPLWPPARKGDPPRASRPEAALALADFVGARLQERFLRRAELARQIEDARNEVELHRRRLAEAGKKREGELRLSRLAVVTLSVGGAAGELTLGVEYLVPGARWSPSYELRLDRALTRGRLMLRAAVAQATGEDWTGVKLSLSTADLDRRTELPELKSLRIGRVQPAPPRSGWREPAPGLDDLFAEYERLRQPEPKRPAAFSPGATVPLRPSAARAAVPPPVVASAAMDDSEGAMLSLDSEVDEPTPAAMPVAGAASRAPMARASRAAAPPRAAAVGRSGPPKAAMMSESEPDVEVEPAVPPGPPPIGVDPRLLDYDALVMGHPDDAAARGRLRGAGEAELMMTTALQLQVDVQVVISQIAHMTGAAQRVGALPLPEGAVALRQSAGSFDHRYDCADRVDVPAAGTWQLVPVLAAEMSVAAEYTCVPSVEPHVYRVLRLENRSPHALLAGPVSVLVEDDYLLTSSLPLLMAGQHAALGLGVAEAIKVARNTSYKETTGGLLGGQSLLQHEIEIEVWNGLGVPAAVEVRERLPVSDEEAIKVEESLVRPEWQKDEASRDGVATRGARAWKVSVPPGAKLPLVAHYTIRIPGDRMLSGGNRRV